MESTELERQVLTGEVVEEDSWETFVSEWATGASQAIIGQLRQARAAANVTRVHGTASMQKFAEEVGVSKSKVYDYRRVWTVYGHLIEDGNTSLSRQVESGSLTMSQLIAKTYSNDPHGEIEGKSSRQIEAENHEEKEQQHSQDERAQKVLETRICEACGSEVPVDG